MSLPTTAYPGLPLGPSSKYAPGPGTHIYSSQIYASLAGPVILTPSTPNPSSSSSSSTKPTSTNLPTLSIARLSSPRTNVLPQVNSTVLCRVTRLQTRQVTVEILVVDEQVCADAWTGVVRREDVRGWEKDKVVVAEGFRVGDLVRAVVVSSSQSRRDAFMLKAYALKS